MNGWDIVAIISGLWISDVVKRVILKVKENRKAKKVAMEKVKTFPKTGELTLEERASAIYRRQLSLSLTCRTCIGLKHKPLVRDQGPTPTYLVMPGRSRDICYCICGCHAKECS